MQQVTAGDTGASMIHDLIVQIIRHGKVPSNWKQSVIVCLHKGKREALDRGNYRGLKLTMQIMKVLERIVDNLIRQLVSIDKSQFGFIGFFSREFRSGVPWEDLYDNSLR